MISNDLLQKKLNCFLCFFPLLLHIQFIFLTLLPKWGWEAVSDSPFHIFSRVRTCYILGLLGSSSFHLLGLERFSRV